MLTNNLPAPQTKLVLPEQPLRTVLFDDEPHALALVLPPVGELTAIAALAQTPVSVQEHADGFAAERMRFFRHELDREERKRARYFDSPTFLNRLANLARAAGEITKERELLLEARKVSDDPFFRHRFANNLLSQGENAAAEEEFVRLGERNDVYALLKVAALHVMRQDMDRARDLVARAVGLDPVDFGVRLFEGGLRLASGDYNLAIHSFRIAAEERPTSSVLFENMASAYLRLGQHEKAYAALKRSVVLNPLNASALFVCADEAFRLRRDDDVIPSLRLYLESEQKNPAAYARLARALMQIGDMNEALVTLRRQATIDSSSAVWNNIGVIHGVQNNPEKALECFKYAVGATHSDNDADALLATRNAAQALAAGGHTSDLVRFTSAIIERDSNGVFRRQDQLADVYAFYLNGLRREQRTAKYMEIATALLDQEDTAPSLSAWALGNIIAHCALTENAPEKAEAAIAKWFPGIAQRLGKSLGQQFMLINNMAFAFAEAGHLDEAARCLAKIAWSISREPYPTATLGLIDCRKGNIERGAYRYRVAIGLARSRLEKSVFRQKFAVELGRYWVSRDAGKARRYFQRAASISHGEPALVAQAKSALGTIAQSPSIPR